MRFFVALDRRSSLKPSVIHRLLELRLTRQQYDVLPLEDSHFACVRSNTEAMTAWAKFAALKICRRYPDIGYCAVVFGVEKILTDTAKPPGIFDYVLLAKPNGEHKTNLLNPPASPGKCYISSPSLQPELAEKLMDILDI